MGLDLNKAPSSCSSARLAEDQIADIAVGPTRVVVVGERGLGHWQLGTNYSSRGSQSNHVNENDKDGGVLASRRRLLHG